MTCLVHVTWGQYKLLQVCVVICRVREDDDQLVFWVEAIVAYTYLLYLWTVCVTVCWSMNDFRMPRALMVLSVVLVLGYAAVCVRGYGCV